MNEFELIARLTRSLATNETVHTVPAMIVPVLDLAVPDQLILFKTDAVVEGIHFTRGDTGGKNRAQGARALLERYRRDGRNATRTGDDRVAKKT